MITKYITMNYEEYKHCFYCDNILTEPHQVGLLHLDFPRCFVQIPDDEAFYWGTFEEFLNGKKNGFVRINWLDPNDSATETERNEVLRKLWNFSILQEQEEENWAVDRDIDEHIEDSI